MIKVKDLTVKNFMSVGNQTQAVDFNKEQLTLVLGENLDQGGDDSGSRNGTGKTTIINALSYALYGQALTNIRRNNLINKTNSKGMLVTLHFEKDNQDFSEESPENKNIKTDDKLETINDSSEKDGSIDFLQSESILQKLDLLNKSEDNNSSKESSTDDDNDDGLNPIPPWIR